MVVTILLGAVSLFFIISGIYVIVTGDVIEGVLPLIFGLGIGALLIASIFSSDSPLEAATNKVVDVKEYKLLQLQGKDEDECYVLRDSYGNYFYITETQHLYSKDVSLSSAEYIESSNRFVIEDEKDDISEPYVIVEDIDAKITAGSLGVKPIKRYTFVVPKGTIKFVEELPNTK